MKFQKLAIVAVSVMVATVARAEPKIEITSIQFPAPRTRMAEVCGKVTDAPLPDIVRLEVDYTMDPPAIYNTPVAKDGQFCLVAVTLRGKIRGTLFSTPGVSVTMDVPAVGFGARR